MFEYSLFMDDFICYCQFHKKLSEKTIAAYRIDLTQYRTFSHELTRESIGDYIVHLNKCYKPKTVKRKIATLKAFVHFLLIKDRIDANPFDKIDTSIKEPLMLPKTIPLDTIGRLISFAYKQIDIAKTDYQIKCSVRNAAIIELLFATGGRVAEICSLHSRDVDIVHRRVKLYGKGSKERVVPIENQSVLNILERYRAISEKKRITTDYFFINKLGHRITEQSVRNMIRNYYKQCGITLHITPHMFRHSFATLLLEEDVDIRYIQRLLGHSSITTTQIYTHVTSAKQKEIIKAKHPRNKLGYVAN